MIDRLFVATKAFIAHQGKILILKESTKYKDGAHSGKFDLVGGRVEKGQNFKESLSREIKEETGLEVQIGRPICISEKRPSVKNEKWQIVVIYFECTTENNKVTLSTDHDEYKWIKAEEYKDHNTIKNDWPVYSEYVQFKK
jgi:8-oxo-dGTP diphosphatase